MLRFEFSGVPAGKRRWWLVGDRGGVDLCLTDPGFAIDLFISTDVRTLTAVWLGDIGLARALESGAIELHGPRHLREALRSWLGLSLVAGVRDQRPAARRA